MPDVNEMKGGKYLKKEDFPEPKIMTISGCDQISLKKQGDEGGFEKRWVLSFDEVEKQLILNSTNIELCARATKERNSDDWGGKKIVLFHDENVSIGGKLVGGIRIRSVNGEKPF
jgi:hypothetical protein